MKTDIKHWLEWRRLCALDLCGDDAKGALRDYATAKFGWYTRKFATRRTGMSARAIVADAGDCWHLFEAHITLGRLGNGKTLKQWIFARVSGSGDPALKVVQGGARLIMRDVVRKHLLREVCKANTLSLSHPVRGKNNSTFEIRDLLPADTAGFDEVERHEIEDAAEKIAREFFIDLEFPPRITLLAKLGGISLANPIVSSVSGKKRSMLSRIWRRTIEELGHSVEGLYAEEDSEWKLALVEQAVIALNRSIISWARVEKRCAKLLEVMEADL